MKILVTAGSTQVFIDRVRCITNIFTGRTGANIALEAYRRGHSVTLLTSHPETIEEMRKATVLDELRWQQRSYRTFQELARLMEVHIMSGGNDAVVHSAAVSDYLPAGVFAPAPGTEFAAADKIWRDESGGEPALVDCGAAKVKSEHAEIWLQLVRAPKLVDMIRANWKFTGMLVKFKLEVGQSDEQLLNIAEKSRVHSQADLMVANTLEGAANWAHVGKGAQYQKVVRRDLARVILDNLEGGRRGPD